MKLLTIGTYILVERHLAVQQFLAVSGWSSAAPVTGSAFFLWFVIHPAGLISWTIVFLLVDLAYYCMHRCSHVVHLFWAGHLVHHSSEEYNLTVALRQSALHGLTSWIFYIPLALLGVAAMMSIVCYALNLVYQFWIHSRVIDRLGALELVLNTPSHHRVHTASTRATWIATTAACSSSETACSECSSRSVNDWCTADDAAIELESALGQACDSIRRCETAVRSAPCFRCGWCS